MSAGDRAVVMGPADPLGLRALLDQAGLRTVRLPHPSGQDFTATGSAEAPPVVLARSMAASDAAELGRSAGDWAACEALAAFRSALPQGEAGLALLAASLPELDGPQSLAGGARRFADLRLVISALAVALAPRARVNAILVPAEDRGGACAKALAYLLTAPSITGQVLVMRPLGAGAP